MIQIEFDYNQIKTVIQANLTDTFQDAINKYTQKALLDPKTLCFLANGKVLDPKKTVESQTSKLNKENNIIKVIVNQIDKEKDESVYVKSKDIICPTCNESCRIKIENYKIKLYDCINNHINIINIKDFQDKQKINISNITCEECNIKNKGNTYNNEFYKCLTCNKNICLLCKNKHESNHNLINYEQKNYICQKHNGFFNKYCTQCKCNLCFLCDEEHIDHETILFNNIIPKINEIKNQLLEIKKIIELFKDNINDIVNKLNGISLTMDLYYQINNDIINNYDIRNINYDIIENINMININNELIEKLKNINEIKNINDKIYNIFDLYDKINIINDDIKQIDPKNNKELSKDNNDKLNIIKEKEIKNELSKNDIPSNNNKLNEMTIIYKIDKNKEKLKIFGDDFVKNNKNNCYLLINGKKIDLCSEININEEQKENLEIKLIETKIITDMNSMFNSCSSLQSLPDISKWDTKNVTDMSYMFKGCSSLQSLPDISIWDINKNLERDSMFNRVDKKLIPKKFQ